MADAGKIVVEFILDDNKVPVAVRRITTALNDIQSATNRTATSVKRLDDAHSSLFGKFHEIVAVLGYARFAMMDLNDVFLRLPMTIMKTAGELERTKAMLGGLSNEFTAVGKANEAAFNFKYITQLAQHAPFDIKALSDSFVKFKSAGLDPTKGSLQALVDGVAKFGGNSEVMQRASVAIQQMMGKGVVSMEELRQQMGEAVPEAMQDMAIGMGISMAELTKAVSKGTVESSDAINKMLVIMQLRNDGAAQDMMKTWVGMTSQLKTQLSLMAVDIADAGFGDAMKKVVAEISNSLKGIEFRQFADAFGSGLGSAVTGLSGFAKVLFANIELIKTAAAAFVFYKLSASFVAPALLSLRGGIGKINDEFDKQGRITRNAGEVMKASSLANLRTLETEAMTQTTVSAQKIAALKAEMVQLQANRVELIASRNAITGPIAAGVKPRDDKGRFISSSVVQQQIADIDKLGLANGAAMVKMKGDIANTEVAYRNSAGAVIQHGMAIDTMTNSAIKGAPALSGLTAAGNLAKGAFLALGGWATALNVAIAAGVYIWMNWGKAGKDAIEAVRLAKKGLASQDTLDTIVGNEKAARVRRDALQAELDQQVNSKSSNTRRSNETLRREIAAQDAIIETQQEAHWQAKATVDRDQARQEAGRLIALADDAVLVIRGNTQKKISAIDAAYKLEIKAAGDNDVKKKAAEKNRSDSMKALTKSSNKETIATLETSIAELETQFNSANGVASVQAVEALREKISEAKNRLNNAINADGANVFIVGKNKDVGSHGSDKIAAMIVEMRADRAKIDAEIEGLLSTAGKLDKAGGIAAKIQEEYESGKFKWGKNKSKNPTQANINILTEGLAGIEDRKEFKKQVEEADAIAKSVSERVKSMQPDMDYALEVMTNPLGTVEQKKGNQFDEWLIHLKENNAKMIAAAGDNQEALDRINKAMEEAQAGSRAAATIDLAAQYKSTVSENQKMGFAIIQDDRARTRLQMAFDNELTAQRIENNIKYAMAHGVSEVQIERMRAAALVSATQHAEQMRLATRTPLEKLADDWQFSLNKMDDASAKWADGFVGMIVSSAQTGKLEFSSLVQSILADILKIQLQRSLGDPLKDIINQGTDWLKGKMPSLGNNGRFDVPVGPSVSASTDASMAALEASRFASHAAEAGEALKTMTSDGTEAATKAIVDGLVTTGQETMASTTFAGSLAMSTNALYAFTAALQAGSGSGIAGMFGFGIGTGLGSAADFADNPFQAINFATGGIMSSMGSVPLRKYAAGGIARSPQMALYGEGSQNEAYVPLPDGKRIPVSMSGAGATPTVTVNVINQSGTQVSAQQGQPRFDGKQMILDVVLTAASQPGGFRDGMKGAMK